MAGTIPVEAPGRSLPNWVGMRWDAVKQRIKRLPILGPVARAVYRFLIPPEEFSDTETYWKRRYARGGDSGAGSFGRLARFKASYLNEFVKREDVRSVIEFGCGDGNQLALYEFPLYLGLDVSLDALARCRDRFAKDPTKSFLLTEQYDRQSADLALSIDVLFHLVEDELFHSYLCTLFDAAERFVVVYSSNTEENEVVVTGHVKHREFTKWVSANRPDWILSEHIPNEFPRVDDNQQQSDADFYIFVRANHQ